MAEDSTDGTRRPARAVTRESVLSAALTIVDRDGVDALSMRNVCRPNHRCSSVSSIRQA